MRKRKTPHAPELSQDTTREPNRRSIPSSDVGVTLTISDEALKKIDQIKQENIKAAQEGQKFSWR